MAAILVLKGGCCHTIDLINMRSLDNFSFSNSISKFERQICNPTTTSKYFRFQVEMRQTELPPRLGTNGRPPVKMVPASEVVKRKVPSHSKVDIVNGKKQVINGASIAKKKSSPALVRTPKRWDSEEFPPVEGLKVLPSDESFSWANKNYNSLQRTIDVWSFVIAFRLRILIDNAKWAYFGGYTEDKLKNRRQRTASWLRERVLQLGPTFIKLGQLSSTRSDLFPREFVDELAKLQDRVPAFSPEKSKKFIEDELGAPIEQLFKKFEDQPIAAASLGQMFDSC